MRSWLKVLGWVKSGACSRTQVPCVLDFCLPPRKKGLEENSVSAGAKKKKIHFLGVYNVFMLRIFPFNMTGLSI